MVPQAHRRRRKTLSRPPDVDLDPEVGTARAEQEGVVSPANHSGKREILVGNGVDRAPFEDDE